MKYGEGEKIQWLKHSGVTKSFWKVNLGYDCDILLPDIGTSVQMCSCKNYVWHWKSESIALWEWRLGHVSFDKEVRSDQRVSWQIKEHACCHSVQNTGGHSMGKCQHYYWHENSRETAAKPWTNSTNCGTEEAKAIFQLHHLAAAQSSVSYLPP